MMYKREKCPPGYSASSVPLYESEGSGSSGKIDSTDDYSAPMRKWVDLNSDSKHGFAVPIQLIRLSELSLFERKSLVQRLTSEIEQIRFLQKKLESQKTKFVNSVTVSSFGDVLNGSNVHQKGIQVCNMKQSSAPGSGPAKKGRGSTGKFESTIHGTRGDLSAGLLKQCESLLKKLMSHQYAWVFNTPVDVVKLNIPDYFDVIKNPMDLGTIKAKLRSGKYSSPLDFLADVRLTFTNAKTYNSPGTDVHVMADTMSQFFELRWKTIDKKLIASGSESIPKKSVIHVETEVDKLVVHSKKRKLSPSDHVVHEPIKRRMTDEDKHKLSSELEDMLADLPDNIIEFLKAQSSNSGTGGEDEIEIDIDVLSDDTLLTLRKLLDDHLKHKNLAKSEACEIELPNVPGLSNSSLQVDGVNDLVDEDVDIGGNEAPVTSCPPVEIDRDKRGRDEEYTEAASVSGLDQLEQSSQLKQYSSDSDGQQAGNSEQAERPVSPDKMYRAALLKERFLDTILKAREKTLSQDDKGDPEKLRREREELEMHKKREKARLQAEAKAAEDARKRAEAEAAEEAKKKRELEREAAREALLKMEKTVEINETLRFLEDLEMLRTVPLQPEQLPSSMDEASPDPSQDGFGNFSFGGCNNPLEQLGLYMKEDDEEEEGGSPSAPNVVGGLEEGQID